jgi:hypothetical protein
MNTAHNTIQQVQVLMTICQLGSFATEQNIAKQLFAGRVLVTRQTLQFLMWSGVLVSIGGIYQLSDAAKANLQHCINRINADQTMAQAAMIGA